MTPALELDGVTKRFGGVVAVDRLSLAVPEGSLFGLIGRNGAGKTTTFGLLLGFLRPDEGVLRARGEVLVPGTPPIGRISALPQDAELPGARRVRDVLVSLARLSGFSSEGAKKRTDWAIDRVGIRDLANKKVGALSHGQRRRVGIASAILGERECILLDEPTAGLDPEAQADLRNLVQELARERTVVLSSHNLLELEAICTHAAIIDKGHLVAAGTIADLKRSGRQVTVMLNAAPDRIDALIVSIRSLPGVRSAVFAEDPPRIELDMADEPETAIDARVNELLRRVLDAGGSIKSVERGRSLEQRFLEETQRLG